MFMQELKNQYYIQKRNKIKTKKEINWETVVSVPEVIASC
jgi:hypothetical protein